MCRYLRSKRETLFLATPEDACNISNIMSILHLCHKLLALNSFRFTSNRSSYNMSKIHKSRRIAIGLREKRSANESSKKNYQHNDSSFKLIGSHSPGFGPSLLVSSENSDYLFNCPEAFQRLCYTNKTKIIRVKNVFTTRSDWDCVAGVYGLSLTLQDIGALSFIVHGPDSIQGLFRASSRFASFNTGINCGTKVITNEQYQDEHITISPILVNLSDSNLNADDRHLKKSKNCQTSIAYLGKLPDIRGALDPVKCKEKKVPIGPMLARLKAGEDVTLSDGRIVKSSEVCEPPNRGLRFLIIDCPSQDNVTNFRSNSDLEALRVTQSSDSIDIVFHFAHNDVAQSSEYIKWIESFQPKCKHLLIDDNRIDVLYVHQHHYLLRHLDDQLFPQLYATEKLASELQNDDKSSDQVMPINENLETKTIAYANLGPIIKMKSHDRLVYRPSQCLEVFDNQEGLDSHLKLAQLDPELDPALASLRQIQANFPAAQEYEPEVVFLGTGSAIPSKSRNTSSILVNFSYPKKASVILDCGEGTYTQLVQHYGETEACEVLKRLKVIYVSHHHTDHHIGLTKLLEHRATLTDDKIILLLPPNPEVVLRYFNQNYQDLSDSYEIISTKVGNNQSPLILDLSLKTSNLLEQARIVPVEHCVNSTAVCMVFRLGHPSMQEFKLAYSGDARPSDKFVGIAQGCDLLIHEATFDHKNTQEALEKLHSTTTEAINVGRSMKAKFTILTHFSQRFPKIPLINENFDERVGFAFDHMRLKCPSHYPRLPALKQTLSVVFKKSLDSIEAQYSKSEQKKRLYEEVSVG